MPVSAKRTWRPTRLGPVQVVSVYQAPMVRLLSIFKRHWETIWEGGSLNIQGKWNNNICFLGKLEKNVELVLSASRKIYSRSQTRSASQWLSGKESAWSSEDTGSSPGGEDPLEKEMTTHSSILAWEIPWTEASGVTKSQTRLRD